MSSHSGSRESPASGHATRGERIQVFRPALPRAEDLLPYLTRIDDSRVYTNYGPLAVELEQRIAALLQLPAGGVTSASSGTVALIGSILGTAGHPRAERDLALLPDYTFVATASAVEQCGYRPHLADVNRDNWALDPESALSDALLDRIGLVVPVAPYGRPVPQEPWVAFRVKTGIPVVVDGAASLETILGSPDEFTGPLPVALSFHATKGFSTAEGGCVISSDVELVARVMQALNYGFRGGRESLVAGTNGKLSEYHAAIGLAELDGWDARAEATRQTVTRYRQRMAAAGLDSHFIAAPEIGSSYALFRCTDAAESERLRRALAEAGIASRLWYEAGLHRHAYFQGCSRQADLRTTEAIAPCVIGLPMAVDLSADQIDRIVQVLCDGMQES